jgi:hypothetical protein
MDNSDYGPQFEDASTFGNVPIPIPTPPDTGPPPSGPAPPEQPPFNGVPSPIDSY